MWIVFFVVLILICCLFTLIVLDGNRFVIRTYDIASPKIKKDFKGVFLADLHNKEYGKDNYKLISAIKEMNPDVILSAGDMLLAKPKETIEKPLFFFRHLREYPVFYGLGNHEYRMKIYRNIYGDTYDVYKEALAGYGIRLMENDESYIPDTGVCVQGLMIDREYYHRFSKKHMTRDYVQQLLGKASDEESFRLLLAHNPEYFEAYAEAGADLVLSGHVHGGIVRLPFLGGVVSPRLSLFPKYDGGFFRNGSSTMILSRGLGSHTIPIRLFNPGELIVINFKKI